MPTAIRSWRGGEEAAVRRRRRRRQRKAQRAILQSNSPHLAGGELQEIKKNDLLHQKTTGNPCFLWLLQLFGSEAKHFCGICSALEVEHLARKDIRPGNHAFPCFVSMCEHVMNMWSSTLPSRQYSQELAVQTFHFRWLGFNLFEVGSGLSWVG